MKFRTEVVREGEWLGPVDWSYDFAKHGWPNGAVNPDFIEAGKAPLRKLEAEPNGWMYSPSGFSAFPVVHVGMYDGWPFWAPTPAIGYVGPMGGVEVAFWYDLQEHKLVRRQGQVELEVVAVPGKEA